MGSLRALALAGAAAMGVTNVATAADLLPPPPPIEQVMPLPVEFGGWYLRGDVGAGINQISNQRSTFSETIPNFGITDSGITQQAIVGIGAGYQFNSWFRADVTGEYRFGNHYHATEVYSGSPNCPTGSGYLCGDGYKGSIRSAVFLANGYLDLGTWIHNRVTPYVGFGVGGAYNTFAGLTDTSITNPGGAGVAADRTSGQFAWALMAGLSYSISQNVKLDFGYRYLDMGRVTSNPIICSGSGVCPNEVQSVKLASHDIRLGLRYMFDSNPGPAYEPLPPPPLVRKY